MIKRTHQLAAAATVFALAVPATVPATRFVDMFLASKKRK
jgi:hypothetical protein